MEGYEQGAGELIRYPRSGRVVEWEMGIPPLQTPADGQPMKSKTSPYSPSSSEEKDEKKAARGGALRVCEGRHEGDVRMRYGHRRI